MYQIIDNFKSNARNLNGEQQYRSCRFYFQSSKHMNLDKISLVSFLLNLVPLGSLESNAHEKKRSFTAPCFDGGENLSTCSNLDDSCENASGFKLVRLQGIRVSGRLEYY